MTVRSTKFVAPFVVSVLLLGLAARGWASYLCRFDQVVRSECCCPGEHTASGDQALQSTTCCAVTTHPAPTLPAGVRSAEATPAALPVAYQTPSLLVPLPARPLIPQRAHRAGPPIRLVTSAFLI